MSGKFRFRFKPLDGTFELDQFPNQAANPSGAVRSGSLLLPDGLEFEIVDGLAITGSSDITLAAGSTISVLESEEE